MRLRRALLAVGLSAAVAASANAQERPEHEFRECADCPVMMAIPAGSFVMGSPSSEPGRFDAEGPQHPVSVRAFALGKFPVTNEEFLVFLRATGYQPKPCDPILGLTWESPGRGLAYPPGTVQPPRAPASCLSWTDAQAYLTWLNGKVRGRSFAAATANTYRLPSEAEWEFAARAGSVTARWWGDAIGTGNANCNGCGSTWDGKEIADVGSFRANPFGLHDILGNVWEWTADCWNESYVGAPKDGGAWTTGDCSRHVLRGGSWANIPVFVRSAARVKGDAGGREFDYSIYAGFRVARTLP